MALKINFKDFKAKNPFRFKARTTEGNNLVSGLESNIEITPNYDVEEGTELNSNFFNQLEEDINREFSTRDIKMEEIKQEIGNIDVSWDGISGKPEQFPPSSHRHSATEITDINYPVTSVAGKTGVVTLNKGDVGLNNVQNYGVATQAQVDQGTANNLYVTPAGLAGLKSSVVNGKQEVVNAINDKLGYSSGLTAQNHTHTDYAWWIRNQLPISTKQQKMRECAMACGNADTRFPFDVIRSRTNPSNLGIAYGCWDTSYVDMNIPAEEQGKDFYYILMGIYTSLFREIPGYTLNRIGGTRECNVYELIRTTPGSTFNIIELTNRESNTYSPKAAILKHVAF